MAKGKTRVIILDDNDLIDILLSRVLEESGFDVVSFRDPKEMLSKIAFFKPQIIFVDHGLPGIKGTDVIKKIVKTCPEIYPCPKIIAITGWGESVGEKMLEAGADVCLLKPFSKSDVLASVVDVTSKHIRLKKKKK